MDTLIIGIDAGFGQLMQSLSSPWLGAFFGTVTLLGDPLLWLLALAYLHWKGDVKSALFFAGAILLAYAVVGPLKEITARPRPFADGLPLAAGNGGYSFPSGHATTVSSVLGYFWSGAALHKALAVCIVLLVMLSRVYLGVHYLSDVVVGTLLGFGIGYTMQIAGRKLSGANWEKRKPAALLSIIALASLAIAEGVLAASPLGSALAGYFLGVLALWFMGENPRASGGGMLIMQGIGFAVLAIILAVANSNGLKPWGFLFAGLWVSLLLPLLWARLSPAPRPG